MGVLKCQKVPRDARCFFCIIVNELRPDINIIQVESNIGILELSVDQIIKL